MNPSEFLSREIIRPLITLAIPGGVAIAPYVYLLHNQYTFSLTHKAITANI